MSSPQVSVCIPTFNKASFLRESIQSVLCQTFEDYELVVLDDASTDDTPIVVKAFGDYRIKYIRHTENIGLPANFNECLRKARADYVIIFHDDDVMLPELLECEVSTLESYPEVAFVHAPVQVIDADGCVYSVPPNKWPPLTEGTEFVKLFCSSFDYGVTMSSVMMRKSIALSLGGFNETFPFSLDANLWQRMAFQGKVAFVNRILLSNRVHSGQTTRKVLMHRSQMLGDRIRFAEETRRLLLDHHVNIDRSISRQLSRHISSDLTQLRCQGANSEQIVRYFWAAVRLDRRAVLSLRLLVYLPLALLPMSLVRALKKLHGRWFLWRHHGGFRWKNSI